MPIFNTQYLKQSFEDFLKNEIETLKNQGKSLCLDILVIGNDFASLKYVKMKTVLAEKLGIKIKAIHLELGASAQDVSQIIQDCESKDRCLLIQLPVPDRIKPLVADLPATIDVDMLGRQSQQNWAQGMMPPTIGAVDLILKSILNTEAESSVSDLIASDLDLLGMTVAIVGQGTLVGGPILKYLSLRRSTILSLNVQTKSPQKITSMADIVISGTGKTGLINSEWLATSHLENDITWPVVIDAGTSESVDVNSGESVLAGDVDRSVVSQSTLVGVPGGVGPITVRYIFWNLICLARLK